VLSIARNIALVPLYLHYLSAVEYGAWLATGGTLVQLLVSDFGVGGVVLQRTAASLGSNDRGRIAEIVGTAWVGGLTLAAILSVASVVFAPFLAELLHLDPAIATPIEKCFALAIIANAVGVIATISGNILRGLQRSVSAGIIQLVAEIIVIAVTVWMLYKGFGLYALAWGMVARAVFSAFAGVAEVLRVCVRDMQLTPSFSATEGGSLVADSSRLFVVAISMRCLTRSDVFLVGSVVGVQAAAAYGITTRIIDTMNTISSQLNSSLLPAMAHLYGEGNLKRFREVLRRITPVLCAVTLIGLATAAEVDEDFVSLWVGGHLYGGSAIAFMFATASLFAAFGFIAYDALMAVGEFRYVAKTFAAFAVIHILLTILLLQFGMVGAPLAATITAAGWGLLFWRRVAANLKSDNGSIGLAFSGIAVPVLIAIVVVGVARWMLPESHSWVHLTFQALLLAVAMIGGVAAFSPYIRNVVIEEVSATTRALGWKRK
jgi:O-antigen/teichoic acid export membrane protein